MSGQGLLRSWREGSSSRIITILWLICNNNCQTTIKKSQGGSSSIIIRCWRRRPALRCRIWSIIRFRGILRRILLLIFMGLHSWGLRTAGLIEQFAKSLNNSWCKNKNKSIRIQLRDQLFKLWKSKQWFHKFLNRLLRKTSPLLQSFKKWKVATKKFLH